MRIAAVSQRLCLIKAGGAIDVHAASNGQFDADPAAVYPRWREFTGWAASASLPSPQPFAPESAGLAVARATAGVRHRPELQRSRRRARLRRAGHQPAGVHQVPHTPSGVGLGRPSRRWLQSGDVLTSYIEGIGEMRHTFVTE
jgi:hypothetical protein